MEIGGSLVYSGGDDANVHSPGRFRANGSLRNQSSFDSAFDVKPGGAMYLPPEQRISLWQVDSEIVCREKGR